MKTLWFRYTYIWFVLSSKFRPRYTPVIWLLFDSIFDMYFIFYIFIPLFNIIISFFICRLYIGFLLSLVIFILCLLFLVIRIGIILSYYMISLSLGLCLLFWGSMIISRISPYDFMCCMWSLALCDRFIYYHWLIFLFF